MKLADALTLTPEDAALRAALRAEQNRLLHRNLPVALMMVVGAAALQALWVQRGNETAMIWFGLMMVVALTRLLMDMLFWHEHADARESDRWRNAYLIGTLVTGLGWALVSALFIRDVAIEPLVFTLLILIGLAAGAVPVLSAIFPLYAAYAVMILAPMSWMLALEPGGRWQLLAVAGVMFLATLVKSARTLNRHLFQALRGSVARDAAYQEVRQARDQAEETARRLQGEITQRQRAEEGIKQAMVQAEAASRAKSEFLARMSHELHTPMNGILGMTELALETRLDAEQRDYLETARDAARALTATIGDVLDYVRLDAGQMALAASEVVLAEVLRAEVETLRPRAVNKGLSLTLEIDAGLPARVRVDPERLRQVLHNLLDNALKFTASGTVSVRLDRQYCAGDAYRAHVVVEDTGIGIPAHQQLSIFEAFSQVDDSVTRRYGGTGLGLTLCARLAELMCGKLWVDSHPGSGSRFHFTFHFDLVEAARPRQALVVSDDPLQARLLAGLLEGEGWLVAQARDGQQAGQRIAESRPDVVLLDLRLAGTVQGLEGAMPVVALTGDEEQRLRALALGFHESLSAPFDASTLRAAVARCVASPNRA